MQDGGFRLLLFVYEVYRLLSSNVKRVVVEDPQKLHNEVPRVLFSSEMKSEVELYTNVNFQEVLSSKVDPHKLNYALELSQRNMMCLLYFVR